jgi:hypothetical protein
MNQYARWPITFGMKGSNQLVGRFMVLYCDMTPERWNSNEKKQSPFARQRSTVGHPLLSSSESSRGLQQTVATDTRSRTLGGGGLYAVRAK